MVDGWVKETADGATAEVVGVITIVYVVDGATAMMEVVGGSWGVCLGSVVMRSDADGVV